MTASVADGLAFLATGGYGSLATGGRWEVRPAAAAAVTCLLAVQLVTQHLVLDHEVGGTVRYHDDYTRIAAKLEPPGMLRSSTITAGL